MAIAIMSCRKLIGICSGTGCLDAYNESKDAFVNNKEILASFFQCIGCIDTIKKDEDWNHKIKQLKNKNVDTIYISKCINVECKDYDKHRRILENQGFKVIDGTHR